MNVVFLAPAEAEFLEAVAYYNQESEGLGFEFALGSRADIPKDHSISSRLDSLFKADTAFSHEPIPVRSDLSSTRRYNSRCRGNAFESSPGFVEIPTL